MIPYKTSIVLDRNSQSPLYLQISNQLVQLIKRQVLLPGAKLPGSRTMAELLGVHRKTVIGAYEELLLQGWIIGIPKKGMFVHKNLPLLQQRPISGSASKPRLQASGFSFQKDFRLERPPPEKNSGHLYLNDGVSDVRLTPMPQIAKEYRSLAYERKSVFDLGYGSTYGNYQLREMLAQYLNQTRGLHIGTDQILITRGSQMALYLASRVLFTPKEYVLVGETNYIAADLTFQYVGAKLLRVPVDNDGLSTAIVEKLCREYAIKAVYITSHHHHPTTVTLSAQRRLHLLNLAQTYGFAIIEDDYDYDFHYDHSPILPLASHDGNGNVIYIGSVCKTVAPVYRIGYLIAPKDFVNQCAKLRRFIDRQGDALLEKAFARFIQNGDLDRHIKKVLKVYHHRRNMFCSLLEQNMGGIISFEIPKGGMAVWALLDKAYSWDKLSRACANKGLIIGDWQRYDMAHTGHNGIRFGFAAYTESEMALLFQKLRAAFEECYPKTFN
ncbi:MocR-like pyridoxine biosynthesis transcription factor PdxR [Pareuzebyella sediminis]|uniref:MocR-like pyridoxine biosynthesis transcription factor PdxR n=1 Tax=Pareuzebyella sediminis TaxID=2607998 RepID=UPI0011ED25DD|nr:PLP-dependent aminotransferase family protein [Pareuzebyella sediminis]